MNVICQTKIKTADSAHLEVWPGPLPDSSRGSGHEASCARPILPASDQTLVQALPAHIHMPRAHTSFFWCYWWSSGHSQPRGAQTDTRGLRPSLFPDPSSAMCMHACVYACVCGCAGGGECNTELEYIWNIIMHYSGTCFSSNLCTTCMTTWESPKLWCHNLCTFIPNSDGRRITGKGGGHAQSCLAYQWVVW